VAISNIGRGDLWTLLPESHLYRIRGSPGALEPQIAKEGTMKEHLKFYIGGRWVEPLGTKTIDVVNPATEQVVGRVSLGTAEDVDKAVAAAMTIRLCMRDE
jgi:hypothetical protein